MLLSRKSPKSQITLFFGPIAQLFPFTIVAHGTFRRVHVPFNDVIGSHHSRLSSRLTGTWYAFMHPRPIQAWNPTVRSPPQINGVDLFGISWFSGVRVSRFPHSCAIQKGFKPCTYSLDPTVTRVHLPS
jgi:hypothetical protein